MAPLPINTCGSNNPQVLNAVKPLYLPEYDIIHAVTSSASGATDLPRVYKDKPLQAKKQMAALGTTSSHPWQFDSRFKGDAEIEEMRQTCQGLSSIPWLQVDMAVPKPPLGPGYAEHVVQRVKACMDKIEAEGKLDCDGVWLY